MEGPKIFYKDPSTGEWLPLPPNMVITMGWGVVKPWEPIEPQPEQITVLTQDEEANVRRLLDSVFGED